MLEQEQISKGSSLRDIYIERKEMCPASSIANPVESDGAVPARQAGGAFAARQDSLAAGETPAVQSSWSQLDHHGSSSEPSSCQQLLDHELPAEHSSHSYSSNEKCDDFTSNSSKLLSTSLPGTAPIRKPVDIMMHKDRINLLRQMSQVFNEEQHVAVVDASSASEDEREDKDSTKENVISKKKRSNTCSEKPGSTLDKKSDIDRFRAICDGKKKSASNGALKPLVSNSSNEVGLLNSEALPLSDISKLVDETNVRNEADPNNSNESHVEELESEDIVPPKKSCSETNVLSVSFDFETEEGKVHHVSSYSKRVQEKISVESFEGENGEHVDIIDGFSFISFEDEAALLTFELPSILENKKLRCGKNVKKDNEQLNLCQSIGKEKNASEPLQRPVDEVQRVDASDVHASQASLQTSKETSTEEHNVSQPSHSSSTESSAFSSSRLDEFLCKNSTLNISYDVPECRKTVEGVSKVFDEDEHESSGELKRQRFFSQKLGKVSCSAANSVPKTLPNTSVSTVQPPTVPNGLSSSHTSCKSRPTSPSPQSACPVAATDSESNVKSSESMSTKSSLISLPCKQPKVLTKSAGKGDRKFLRPKSSEVFVCRGGKLVPLTSIIKRGAPPKVHEKKKTSDLIYVYHDGKFLTMGGSLCNVDPRYSKSLTSQVVLPINVINKPNQKRKSLTHSNFRAVLIDKRMADFALSALRKPIPTYKDFHKNGAFVRNSPLTCRRQGALAKVKPPRTTKSSILDIISEKLAIDVGDSASHVGNENFSSELELRDSKLVQKNLHRFPSLSREMKRLDKKYVPSERADAEKPGWAGVKQPPFNQQRGSSELPTEELLIRGSRASLEHGVRVKRCEVKVPWYRLPPSLKVWCLVHHCYDCNCGFAAPPADRTSPLKEPHCEGVKRRVGFHQDQSVSEICTKNTVEKDYSRKDEANDKLEIDVTGDQTVSKVIPDGLSHDAAFIALFGSSLSRDGEKKKSQLQNCPLVETSKSSNKSTCKNPFNGLRGISSQRMSGVDMLRDCRDKNESSSDNNKTHLGLATAEEKATEHGGTSKTGSEAPMNRELPNTHPQRKREGSFGAQDEWTSSKCKKFKSFIPKHGLQTSNVKSLTEDLTYKRTSTCKILGDEPKSLEKLSLLGSSFSSKMNFNSRPAVKTTDDLRERNIDESTTVKSVIASDAVNNVSSESENTCERHSVLPECVILELCVGQREGSAGRASGPTIHNIIKHWSHDSSHSARTCGYSSEGKTYRAVVNPQKQGFDYTPPVAPCNSNATIKSVLSAFLKRGYIRDVQNEDRTLKYVPEEANAVYCHNRNISVVENKTAIPAAQILLPREGCHSPVCPLPASSCESLVTPVSTPNIQLNCPSSKPDNCVDVAAEKSPFISTCLTSSGIITATTTTSSTSLCSPGGSGEMKLKIAWKRGQSGDGVAVANSVSLPEMMQAEERRGELELDLSPAPPGTAMLVTEARFRKLINMNIIGVTGLNKQSRCIIAPVESSEMLAKMRFIQTQISNRLLDVGPNMRDIFFPPHQPTGTVVKPRFIMIRCDKSGSWEIVGLVQKKSSEHQADNVHFTTSDIFDTSPTKKAYGGEQSSLKSEISSAIGPFKKSFPSLSSSIVSMPLSSTSSSSNEKIHLEIGVAGTSLATLSDLKCSDAPGSHEPPTPLEHNTLHLSSDTSVTNCRTKPLPSLSSELLTSAKPLSLCSVKAPEDLPKVSFNLISYPDALTSESSSDIPSLTHSSPTSSLACPSTHSKVSPPTFVNNKDFSCVATTDASYESSSSCQTTSVTSSLASSSCISTICEPAPMPSFSHTKRNLVYKVPLIHASSLLPRSTQAALSASACSKGANVTSALETDVGPVTCQRKDNAATSQSSIIQNDAASAQSSLFKNSSFNGQSSFLKASTVTSQSSLQCRASSIKSQLFLLNGEEDTLNKLEDYSKQSLSPSKPAVEAHAKAQILSFTEKSLQETQIDEKDSYAMENNEKPPFSLALSESRPSELSSLSMTSLSSKSTSNSLVTLSLEPSVTTKKGFTKPAVSKGMKWAAIDMHVNFNSIKLGWLKGTIQKSILVQIFATSLKSSGVVTFTVRGSEEETILYGRSKAVRKPNVLLLILGSSIATLDLANGLSNFDLFKNNLMAYVFRRDDGERMFYRYIALNLLIPIEPKKEGVSPAKPRCFPIELFRKSNISRLLLKGSENRCIIPPSGSKSNFSCLSTNTPDPQSKRFVSELIHNENLKDGKGKSEKVESSLSVHARQNTEQFSFGADTDAESITVSSEATDGGVPLRAVLSCHEITHFSSQDEDSCSAQSTTSWCSPPGKEPVEPGPATESSLVAAASSLSSPVPCSVTSLSPPLSKSSPTANSAFASVAREEDRYVSSQAVSSPQEIQSDPSQEHELSICLAEDSVQIFPAEDEGACDEVTSLTVSSAPCDKERTPASELLGGKMKICMRRSSFVRTKKAKAKARKGSRLLQRYSNGCQSKDLGARAWRVENNGTRVGGSSSFARMRAAVARGHTHKKSGKAIKLKRIKTSHAGGPGAHPSGGNGDRPLLELTEGAVSDGYGSSSGSSRASRRTSHGRGKDSSHNEMERLRRKEIGELFVELQTVLQQEKGEDLPECKKEVWPKRMTLKMAISLLEAKREQQWVLARKVDTLLQQFNANKRRLRNLLEHSQASTKDSEAAEELLKRVAPPSRVKELELLEQWATPAAKRCRPDSSDEEYVLDVEGSDSNTSEDLCTTVPTPAASPPYSAFPRALSTQRPGQKLSKISPLGDASLMRRLFVQENGKRKKLASSEPCKSGRGQGRVSLLAYEGSQSRDSSSDAADDVNAAAVDSGGESSASDASAEAPPSLSFSTLSFSNLPSQLLPTSMCPEPLLPSASKPSSPDRDFQ